MLTRSKCIALSQGLGLVVTGFLMGVLSVGWAQAPRLALVEIFTSTTCSACAVVEPAWHKFIYEPRKDRVVVVAYHVPIPSADPFYQSSQSDVDVIQSYYGVNFTPQGRLNGRALGSGQSMGHLAYITGTAIDQDVAQGSPVAIWIQERYLGNATYRIYVYTKTVSAVSGTFVLRVAAVERHRNYVWFSNEHLYFIFRGFITAANGDTIVLPPVGSVRVDSFDYQIPGNVTPAWLPSELYIAAWIQNTGTKEVLNAAHTLLFETLGTVTTASTSVSLTTQAKVYGSQSNAFAVWLEDYTVDFPASWSGQWQAASQTASLMDTLMFSLAPADSTPITVTVQPNGQAGIGRAEFVVRWGPDRRPLLVADVLVVAGITDLVVNNSVDLSYNVEELWLGVQSATPGTAGLITSTEFRMLAMRGANFACCVKNIYYNVPWTFPALIPQEVPALRAWLNQGGNLFICGQDVGWSVWEGSTDTTLQNFYLHYLHARYLSDYIPSLGLNPQDFAYVRGVGGDPVSGPFSGQTHKIFSPYGLSANPPDSLTYYYPDYLDTFGGSTPMLLYVVQGQVDTGGVAAVRYQGNYKTVYMGIGLEMFEDSAVAVEIARRTCQWFWGTLSGEELDQAIHALFVGLYPNPASNVVWVRLPGTPAQIEVLELSGKRVLIRQTEFQQGVARVDVSWLPTGTYLLRVCSAQTCGTQVVQIVR